MPAIPDKMNFNGAMTSLYDHRVALKKANGRITATRKWYESVRKQYANPPAVR